MNNLKDIFKHTDCISEEMLLKYISNKLPSAEKHEVEKHLVDCEMCSDAVDGLKMMASPQPLPTGQAGSPKERELTARKAIDELNDRIQKRAGQKNEVKIIFLRQYRTQLAVAASIVLILGLVWFFRNNVSMNEMSPASSDKIFADKIEPGTAEKKEESPDPLEETIKQPDANKNISGEKNQEVLKTESQPAVLPQKKEDEGYFSLAQDANMTKAGKTVSTGAAKSKAEIEEEQDKNIPKDAKAEYITIEKESESQLKQTTVTTSASGAAAGAGTYSTNEKQVNKNVVMISDKSQADELKTGRERTNAASYELELAKKKESKANKKSRKLKSKQVTAGYYDAESNVISAVPEEKVPGGTVDEQAITTAAPVVAAPAVSKNAERLDSVKAVVTIDNAIEKYSGKDYTGATTDFEQILQKDPNNEQALYYSAVSYLNLGQTDKAITNFNKVLLQKNGKYYDDAQWQLSLAYIQKQDKESARKNLRQLQANPKSKYQKQADVKLMEIK